MCHEGSFFPFPFASWTSFPPLILFRFHECFFFLPFRFFTDPVFCLTGFSSVTARWRSVPLPTPRLFYVPPIYAFTDALAFPFAGLVIPRVASTFCGCVFSHPQNPPRSSFVPLSQKPCHHFYVYQDICDVRVRELLVGPPPPLSETFLPADVSWVGFRRFL